MNAIPDKPYFPYLPERNPPRSAVQPGTGRIPWQPLGTGHRKVHLHPAVSTVRIPSQTEEAGEQLNRLGGR